MTVKNYVFDFIATAPEALTIRVPISSLTIRRRLDSNSFSSVTLPNPEQQVPIAGGPDQSLIDIINQNLTTGQLVLKHIINGGGSEVIVGTYDLEQILSTTSPSAFTAVLNGVATFDATQNPDLPNSNNTWVIDKPITDSSDSNGLRRFSAAENALIIIDDTITLQGSSVTVQEVSLFASAVNSRMDLGVI